jgi:hypothetical protein
LFNGYSLMMKSVALIFCLVLLLCDCSFGTEPSTNNLTELAVHHWAYIEYPWNLPNCPTFLIGWPAGGLPGESSRGLRMDVLNISQGFAFLKTNPITAKLFRTDGQIVEPTAEGKKLLNAPTGTSTGMVPGEEPSPQVLTYFPWGPNVLEESWIKVTIGSERYWVEVPYGFDRNPADPLAPAKTNGPPRFAPEMNSLNEHDHVVRWDKVQYDLGYTANGRELKLIQHNPFDAQSDVSLYSDSKSENVYSPRTQVRLFEGDNTIITGRCVNIHLGDDYLGRTDTFNLIERGTELPRVWGKIEVRVGDQTFNVTVPSSLYRYCHGHASKPATVDYRSKLRIGMTLEEADLYSGNYMNGSIRNHAVPSVPDEYRFKFWNDTNAVTLQFGASNKLVSWR